MLRRASVFVIAVVVMMTMSVITTHLDYLGPQPAAAQSVTPEPPAGARTSLCSTNSTSSSLGTITSEHSSGFRCIAGRWRATRSGLRSECLTDARVVGLGHGGGVYEIGECKGTKTFQAEAVAQTRFIQWLNLAGTYGTSGSGIGPGVQWEVAYDRAGNQPDPLKQTGRLDVLGWHPSGSANAVDIMEVKQVTSTDTVWETTRDTQLNPYVQNFPVGSSFTRNPMVIGGYRDWFTIEQKCDGSRRERSIKNYEARTRPDFPGILGVELIDDIREPCPRVDEPVEPPEHYPPFEIPAYGEDEDEDGKDDFLEVLQEHPELWYLFNYDPENEPDEEHANHSWIPDLSAEQIAIIVIVVGALALIGCFALGPCTVAGATAFLTALLGKLALGLGFTGGATATASVFAGFLGLLSLNMYGDPHIATLDRFSYDLQAVGEFHLLEIPSLDVDVQARFVPVGTSASRLGRVATIVNDTEVDIDGGTLRLNGAVTPLAPFGFHDLGDGAGIFRRGGEYIVLWPGEGDRLAMYTSGQAVGFRLPEEAPDVRGLLGNANGNRNDDLAYRDGTPLPPTTSATTLHGSYANSWRVANADSAFTYGPGQSTATFTNLAFPASVLTIADFTEEEIALASEVCLGAGVQPGPQFEDCVFDVAVTGDDSYADDAALVTDVLLDGSDHGFDASGSLAEDFEGTVGPNFSSPRYSSDPSTSRVAGPIFDTSGYRVYARNIARHREVGLEADLYTYGPVGSDERAQRVAVSVGGTAMGTIEFDGDEPTLTGSLSGTVQRTGVGATANGTPFSEFHVVLRLPHSASSLDIGFAPTGFKGLFGTSLAFDDIALDLDVAPAQTFALSSLPIIVPSASLPSSTGAGRFEQPGDQDEYTFTLPQATRLVLEQRSCSARPTFTLVAQATGTRTAIGNSSCSDEVSGLLPAGDYTLEATAPSAGSYRFELLALPAPQDFAYDLGTVVSPDVPAAGAGTLETIASVDRYAFTVPTGGLTLQHEFVWGNSPYVIKEATTGSVVVPSRTVDLQRAFTAGDYVLEVGPSYDTTYSFSLAATPAPQVFDYALGSIVSNGVPAAGAGNIETAASIDSYRFTVPSGGLDLQYEARSSTRTYSIRDRATGQEVRTGTGGNARFALPAGDYQMDMGSRRGTYSFALFVPPPPQTFPIEIGATVSDGVPGAGAGNLETIASSDRYELTVPAGGRLLQYESLSGSTPYTLRDRATGATVRTSNGRSEQFTLAAGDYVLEYSPGWVTTYSFTLLEIPAPQDFAYTIGTVVSDGVPAPGAGNMETGASVDRYLFTVPSGGLDLQYEHLIGNRSFKIVNRTSGVVVHAGGGGDERITLPAGNYRLDFDAARAVYSFTMYAVPLPQVFDIGVGAAVSIGVPSAGAGNLETMASVDRYQVTIPTGGLTLQYEATAGGVPYIVKDRSTGAGVRAGAGNEQFTLLAGDYTFEFSRPNWKGTYGFTLFSVPLPEVFDYTLGTIVSNGSPAAGAGNMETIASIDQYRFTVPSGGLELQYNRVSATKAYRVVNIATGVVVATGDGYSRRHTLSAGSYRLEYTASRGTYSFALFAVPGAQTFSYTIGTTVANGSPAVGAGNLETIASVDRYQFTVPAGGLDLQYENLAASLTYTLRNRATGALVRTNCCNERFILPAGDYELEYRGEGSWSGTYGFKLYEVPAPQVFDYTLDTLVSDGTPWAGAGRLETIASVDRYHFTLAASTELQFERVGSARQHVVIDRATGATVRTGTGNSERFTLPAGDYAIEYRGATLGATTYYLKLYEVPAPQVFDYQVTKATVVDFPDPGASTLETMASVDKWRFSVQVTGERDFQFDHLSGSGLTFALRNGVTGEIVQTWSGSRVLTLTQGPWRIEVSGTQATTYSWKLYAFPAPQVFPYTLGTAVTDGYLETAVYQQHHNFQLGAEDELQYERLGSTRPYRIVNRTSGAVVFTGTGQNQRMTLPAGQYRVEFSGFTGTYGFKLFRVPAPHVFDYVMGTTVSAGDPFTYGGNIETIASEDRYKFTVPGGGRTYQLENPSGVAYQMRNRVTDEVVYVGGATRQFTLTGGGWRLEYRPGYVTTYSFKMYEVPAPQAFDYTLGDTVSDGVPAVGAGNLETIASVDEHRFTIPAGGLELQFRRLGSTRGFTVIDRATGATVRTGSGGNERFTLPAGSYALRFAGSSGTYSFTLFAVPAPQTFTYALGTTVSNGVPAAGAGNVETIASTDRYHFTVPAGGLDLQYEYTTAGLGYVLRNRVTGAQVRTGCCTERFVLPAGDYELEFAANGWSTTYGFKLYEVPNAQVFDYALGSLVSDGVPATGAGNLETIVSIDQYRFTVPSGGMELQYERVGSTRPHTVIDRATGTQVRTGTGQNQRFTLPAGDYTIQFTAATAGTGPYYFKLFEVPAPQVFTYAIGSTVGNGVPAAGAGNIETIASADRYHFTVPTGGMSFQYEYTSGGYAYTLRDRTSGTTVRTGSGNERFTLAAGHYELEFAPGYLVTYGFKLFEVPAPQVFDYTLGTSVTNGTPWAGAGNLETIASTDQYRLTVPTGGLSLQFERLGSTRGYTVVDRSNGSSVRTGTGSNERFTLPAGDYTVQFAGFSGTYGFRLFEVPAPQTFTYTLGSTVSNGVPAAGAGNLETIASLDRYHFTVPAGGLDLHYEYTAGGIGYVIRDRATGTQVRTGCCTERFTLPAGDYELETNQPGLVGAYGFRLYAVPAPQAFPYAIGSTVSNGAPATGAGNLETGSSVDRYDFTVPAGGLNLQYERISSTRQHLVIDRTTGTTVRTGSGANERYTLPAGDYTLQYTAATVGAGTYSFRLFEVPAPQTFAYTLGSTVSNGVPAAGAGNIETIASVDRYHFTVPATADHQYEYTTAGLSYVLRNRTTGTQVRTGSGHERFTLPAGDYELEYAPNGWVGTYGFKLYEVPAPQVFAYSLGSTVANGAPAAGAGNLETIASVDRYDFTVLAGGLTLQYERISSTRQYTVVDRSTGTTVRTGSGANERFSLAAGDYAIQFNAATVGTGTYGFRLFEVPAPQVFDHVLGSTVANGVPATGAGNIETIASVDRYHFTVPATADYQYEYTTGGLSYVLRNRTTGTQVRTGSGHERFTLPAGDYELEYAPNGWVGTYGFKLYEVPSPQMFTYGLGWTVSNGVPSAGAGNLETVASVDRYDFTVPAGGLALQYERISSTRQYTVIDRTTGATVRTGSGSNERYTLPAGDYRLQYSAATVGTGTYSFKLFEVPAPQVFDYVLGSAVANGVPATGAGNIETIASVDRYRFTVPAGGLDLKYEGNGSGLPYVIRDRATGTTVRSGSSNQRFILPAGDYEMEFALANWLGTYGFKLYEVPAPQVFDHVLGSTVSNGAPAAGAGNLETGASVDQYRFTVPAGGLELQYERVSSTRQYTVIDRATGTTVRTGSGSNERYTLPAGDYTLQHDGAVTGTGTYSFRLFEAPAPQVFTYALGTTVSNGVPATGAGNIETIASLDRYRFSVPAGGLTLQYEWTNGGIGYLIRNRATGTTVHTGWNHQQVTLPAGDYELETNQPGWVGTYGFRLYVPPAPQVFDYTFGSSVSDGVPSAGAGNLETMLSADVYRFTVPTGGRTMTFQRLGGSSTQRSYVVRDRSTGTTVFTGSGNYQSFTLGSGDYELVVANQTSTTYSFVLNAA